MYESWFGLSRRPFATTPDPSCFFATETTQGLVDELLVCAESGQGVGLLLGEAGVGKTVICERLVAELEPRFAVIFLPHSGFGSRRALLQTLLAELGRPYANLSDQELRLQLIPAIREMRKSKEGVVVLVDEAHQLGETLLEELRMLADLADQGVPFVRLILIGQLALEEKLTHPQLQPLNQRLRAHLFLPTMTQAESWEYVDYRVTWGGGRLRELFSPEALELIVTASDGSPRCLNQLCDHALLLSYVAEERPVSRNAVEEALDDLQHLPLHWRMTRKSSAESVETAGFEESPSSDPAAESPMASAEVGSDLPTGSPALPSTSPKTSGELAPPKPEKPSLAPLWVRAGDEALDLDDLETLAAAGRDEIADDSLDAGGLSNDSEIHEEYVVDQYTAMEAGLTPDPLPPSPVERAEDMIHPRTGEALTDTWDAFEFTPPDSVIDRLLPLLEAARNQQSPPQNAQTGGPSKPQDAIPETVALERSLHQQVLELQARADESLRTGADSEDTFPIGPLQEQEPEERPFATERSDEEEWASVETTAKPAPKTPAQRPYQNLFSRLRLKQLEERSES